jgi:hypothetical protein
MRTSWQVSVIEHLNHIGPFLCGVIEGATLLNAAQARNYEAFDEERAEMFRELDALVDEGLICRARASDGVVYHYVDQCPITKPMR